jgi:predicted ATP-binding protein involved in virulence
LAAFKKALPAGVGTFDAFYAWFREREDIENEERAQGKLDLKDPQLEAVRGAVAALLQDFSNLRIERKLRRMTVQKHGEILDVTQLSAGEKALLTLVSDLARRLALANPEARDPRLGEGVVLIDEIDLHLHPRWQRMLLPSLERTFPNCQFIVTTHSPQVISDVKPECIYLLERTQEGEIIARRPEASFGLDSNRILEDLMGVDERPKRIKEQLLQFFRLIDEGKLDEAKALRRELEAEIGSDEPNFAKGDVLIRRKEMLAGAPHRPQR